MSDEFAIDIVIHPNVAPGKAAVERALTDVEGRATKANRQVHEALKGLGEDLLSGLASEATSLESAIDKALSSSSRKLDAFRAREASAAAAALRSAQFSGARSALGSGGPSFGDFETATGDQALDLFEGWKAGAEGAGAATSRLAQVTEFASSGLGRLGVAAGVAFAVKKVIDYSDAYTSLQNRLATVTEGSDDLANTTRRLAEISDNTRSSLTATGAFYARLAANTADLGISHERLFNITETLNKAFKVSGASATESGAAMVQLSQGLASGTLRGDELNSVLEQAPFLGRAIAESMGISFGALRKVASEGKVTSKEVIAALEDIRGEVDEKFSKTAPTFGDLFTKLQNSLVLFAGQLAPLLQPIIGALEGVLGAVGPVLGALGSVASVLAPGVELLSGALKESLELVAKIAKGVKDILDLPGRARDGLADALGGRVDIEAVKKAAVDDATEATRRYIAAQERSFVIEKQRQVAELERIGVLTEEETVVARVLREQVDAYKAMDAAGVAATTNVANAMNTLQGSIAGIRIKQIVDDYKTFESAAKAILPVKFATEELKDLTLALDRAVQAHTVSEEERVDVLQAAKLALSDLKDPVGARIGQLKAETANLLEQAKAGGAELEYIKEKQRLLGAGVPLTNADELALARAVKAHHAAEEAVKKHNKALGDQAKAIADVITIEQEHARSVSAAMAAANENRGKWSGGGGTLGGQQINFVDFFDVNSAVDRKFDDQARVMEERRRKYEEQLEWMRNGGSNAPGASGQGAARSPWQQMLDDMIAVDLQTQAMTKGMGALSGAIDQLVDNGKVDFRSLVDSMARDMTKLFLNKAFASFLSWAGGGGSASSLVGGGPPGLTPITAATGGSWMVGGDGGIDTTPVYMRLTRGERLTVETSAQQAANDAGGGGGGGGNVRSVNAIDPDAFYAVLDTPRFERAVYNVIRRHPAIGRAGR